MKDKLRYYMSLFLYVLRTKNEISKNSLYRYIYIYDAAVSYLENRDSNRVFQEFILDSNIGLVNVSSMEESLHFLYSNGLVTLESYSIKSTKLLVERFEKMKTESQKVKDDLNRVTYFVNVISSYSDEVILSVFFNEPNVEDALSRNKMEVSLQDNGLKNLLTAFQKQAKKSGIELDTYDTFISWLDFVFEEYLERKQIND